MAVCPVCKIEQVGYEWTITKNGKKWLMNKSGKWHDCPKSKKQSRNRETYYNVDIFAYNPTFEEQYHFCGKCNHICVESPKFYWWCEKCGMYPNVTNRGLDESDNNHKTSQDVRPLMHTNYEELNEKYRRKLSDAPVNAINMNPDGTIKKGYTLTEELQNWYEKKGRDIIITMHSEMSSKPLEK